MVLPSKGQKNETFWKMDQTDLEFPPELEHLLLIENSIFISMKHW